MKKIALILTALAAVTSCCDQYSDTIPVIPQPQKVKLLNAQPLSVAGATLVVDDTFGENVTSYAQNFAQLLASACPCEQAGPEIKLVRDNSLPKEAYTLTVGAKDIIIRASELNGAIYAIQTLKQLLPVEIYTGKSAPEKDWTVRRMVVKDEPRFAYRGMHLDVGRHFFGVDEVKSYIDAMEMHKMNFLHFHLTEDQGWRVEIKKYPKLTEVGSVRRETIIGHTKEYDHTPYGGFYTQDDIREIVAYAAARGITIIPEVDLPGHMQAALAAYPELGCTGGPYEVWCKWGVSENVLCVGKEEVFTFLEDVISELCDLFPGEYFHIGGDECPKTRWRECPECQAKIAELGLEDKGKFTAEDYLQSYVTKRMEDFLATKGRKIIGWDEILQGELSPNATVMSWRGIQGGITASQMGHDVIMTPNTFCYFDYCQTLDPRTEPISIGGFLPIDQVYGFEPIGDEMTKEEASHILGVQANMWTEYVSEMSHLQYMILPREDALCEVQWCAKERKNWDSFVENLSHMRQIYDELGYNYAKHVFDPNFAKSHELMTVKHKAVGRKATSLTTPHPSYTLHAPLELFDGILAEPYFGSGNWIGYYGEPLDVIVKIGGKQISSVSISTGVDKPDYILNMTSCRISVSKNGKDFTEIASASYPTDTQTDPEEKRLYKIEFPATKAKYLRVEAFTDKALPEWHPGAGETPFLFVDEIIVD